MQSRGLSASCWVNKGDGHQIQAFFDGYGANLKIYSTRFHDNHSGGASLDLATGGGLSARATEGGLISTIRVSISTPRPATIAMAVAWQSETATSGLHDWTVPPVGKRGHRKKGSELF
jgi:hypothetical protein